MDRAGRQGSTGGANLAPVKRADILLRHCNIHLRIRWGRGGGAKWEKKRLNVIYKPV